MRRRSENEKSFNNSVDSLIGERHAKNVFRLSLFRLVRRRWYGSLARWPICSLDAKSYVTSPIELSFNGLWQTGCCYIIDVLVFRLFLSFYMVFVIFFQWIEMRLTYQLIPIRDGLSCCTIHRSVVSRNFPWCALEKKINKWLKREDFSYTRNKTYKFQYNGFLFSTE